jgi:hypothetical protein
MIDDGPHRGPHGDQRNAWADICADYPALQDRAARYECGRELEMLTDRARHGVHELADWHNLLGEVADRAGDAADFTWRQDTPTAATVEPSMADPDRRGFACPANLCARRAGPSLAERPRCALLRRDMVAIP